MITRKQVTQWISSHDQKAFDFLKDAQAHEVEQLLIEYPPEVPSPFLIAREISKWIVEHQEKIIDVLTTTLTSKNKARAVNGGTKKRKSKKTGLDAPETTPVTEENP